MPFLMLAPEARARGRILMVGALSIRFVRDNWVASLRQSYDAAFVDVAPLRSAYSRELTEEYLYRLIQQGGFAQLFFYSEAVQAEFSDTFFERARGAGLEVIGFHADDDPEVWFRQNAAYDHRYDRIYSPSRAGWQPQAKPGVEQLPVPATRRSWSGWKPST